MDSGLDLRLDVRDLQTALVFSIVYELLTRYANQSNSVT